MDATRNQKITATIVFGSLVVILIGYFVLWTPFRDHRTAVATDKALNDQIHEAYSEIIRLYSERDKFYAKQNSIAEMQDQIFN